MKRPVIPSSGSPWWSSHPAGQTLAQDPRYGPGGPRYSSQGGPTGPRSWIRKKTSVGRKRSRRFCGPARLRIKAGLRTRRFRQNGREDDCLCESTECVWKLGSRLLLACTVMLSSRHTTVSQGKIQPRPWFIESRLRALDANFALCLVPPTPAEKLGVFARPRHLRGSFLPPLAEHSSRWSCPSLHGN